MNKVKNLINNKKLLLFMMIMTLCLSMSMCFAAETPSAPDFSPIITALGNVISPGVLITIIAATIGVGAAFVLMWFGFRKLKAAFVKGFTSGKL